MCIYCGTTKYRKIYENHHGPIPKEADGRKYDIHHIDGNHYNNDPTNLIAVTVAEHYAIHKRQNDYSACLIISHRLSLSPEEITEMAKKNAKKRVVNGTHHLLGGEVQRRAARKLVEEGKHHLQDKEKARIRNAKRIAEGTHNFQDAEKTKERAKKLVAEGKHHFLGDSINRKLLDSGRHPSQIKKVCEHCGKITAINMYSRFHGNRCKYR